MTGRKLRTVLPVILMLLCAACETAAPVQRSSSPATQVEYDRQAPISLFADDATVLSDADIDRILHFHYAPPAQARVAVLALGQEVWFGYSDELAHTGAGVRKRIRSPAKDRGDSHRGFLSSDSSGSDETVSRVVPGGSRAVSSRPAHRVPELVPYVREVALVRCKYIEVLL